MHGRLTAPIARLLRIARLLSVRALSAALIQRVLLQGLRPCLLLCRIHLEWQEATQLTRCAANLTTETRLTEDATDRAPQWPTDLTEQVAKKALRCDLSLSLCLSLLRLLSLLALLCLELLQLLKLLHLLLYLLLLLGELGISLSDRILLEGQQASELAGDTADLPAESCVPKEAANSAAGGLPELPD